MKFLSGKDKKQLQSKLPKGYSIDKKEDIREKDNILYKGDDKFLISLEGEYLPHLKSLPEKDYKSVYVDKGAIPFLLNGAVMMRPGIQKIDDGFEKGEIIIVRDENHNKCLGLGFAEFSSDDMKKQAKGKAVRIYHYVSDEYY